MLPREIVAAQQELGGERTPGQRAKVALDTQGRKDRRAARERGA